jgi:hypothetical protein
MYMDTWVAEAMTDPAQAAAMQVQVPDFLPDLPDYHDYVLGTTHVLDSKLGSKLDPSLDPSSPSSPSSPPQPTILVTIASYRDPMCPQTVTDLLTKARHPYRLRIAVVQQNDDGGAEGDQDVACGVPAGVDLPSCSLDPLHPHHAMCLYHEHIDVYQLPAKLATGPVTARAIGSRMYAGEKYAVQIDAHLGFVRDWDALIVDQFLATSNAKAVLTTYLTDIEGSIDAATGRSRRSTTPVMCNSAFEKTHQGSYMRHNSQPEVLPQVQDMPTLSPYFAAGFFFASGQFVRDVPYDPYLSMVFMGEEISMGVRGWTHGYDTYTPRSSVCFHYYAIGKNASKRKKVKRFWENSGEHAGSGRRSMQRLLGLIDMNPDVAQDATVKDLVKEGGYDDRESDLYGMGSVRQPQQFYHMFGIDVMKRTSAPPNIVCKFVTSGSMHRDFHGKLLRMPVHDDGMADGIDYNSLVEGYTIPGVV